jgi:hypothetical protein
MQDAMTPIKQRISWALPLGAGLGSFMYSYSIHPMSTALLRAVIALAVTGGLVWIVRKGH